MVRSHMVAGQMIDGCICSGGRAGFSALSRLENDASTRSQAEAFYAITNWVLMVPKWDVIGPMWPSGNIIAQDWLDILICGEINLRSMSQTRALAGLFDETGIVGWTTIRATTGRRLWNDAGIRGDGN